MERCFNIGVNLYDKRSEKLLFFLAGRGGLISTQCAMNVEQGV